MNSSLILWIQKLPFLANDFFLSPNKIGCLKTIYRGSLRFLNIIKISNLRNDEGF